MKGLNKVILLGNLGKDPEVKYTTSGKAVAKLALATNEKRKNKDGEYEEHTEWHNVIFWEKLAEIVEKYLKKGSKIFVEGRIQTRSWEKDGEKKYMTEIVGSDLVMLDSAPEKQASTAVTANKPITDDDIPF